MEPTPTPPTRRPTTLQDLETKLSGLALLQGTLLAGLVILFAQVNGVPDLTAQRVPSDQSGEQADFAVGPMASDITDLQATVRAMSAKIDAICAAVADKVPAPVSPNPCVPLRAPTPAP